MSPRRQTLSPEIKFCPRRQNFVSFCLPRLENVPIDKKENIISLKCKIMGLKYTKLRILVFIFKSFVPKEISIHNVEIVIVVLVGKDIHRHVTTCVT